MLLSLPNRDVIVSKDDLNKINPYIIIIEPNNNLLFVGAGYELEVNELNNYKLSDLFRFISIGECDFDYNEIDLECDYLVYKINKENRCIIRGKFYSVSNILMFRGELLNYGFSQKINVGAVFFFEKIDHLLNRFFYSINSQKFFHDLITSSFIQDVGDINSVYAITISDISGNVIWCNDSFIKLSGKTFDEIRGKRPREAIYGKGSVYVASDYVDNMVAKKEPFYFENLGFASFWFGASVFPLFDDNGNNIGRVHFMNDVSERRILDIKRENDGNWLGLCIESANIGLWAFNAKSLETDFNDKFRQLLGFNANTEVSYYDVYSLIEKNGQIETFIQCFTSLTIKNPSSQINKCPLKINGVELYFKINTKCILFSDKGNPLKIVGTLIDVTEEVLIEKQLSTQKEFYLKILNEMPADVVIISSEFKYKFVNKHAIKDSAIREWIIDKDDFDYCKYRNKSVKIASDRQENLSKALNNKEEVRFIEYIKNIQEYKLRIYEPILNEKNEVDHIIGYGLDVTEQIQAIEKEKELNNQKSKFINITSHELRTPLTIIYSNAELLQMINQNDKLNIYIDRVLKEVDSMTEILNELMLVSKIEKGDIDINKTLVDVKDYISDISALFRPYRDGRSVEIDIARGVNKWIFDKKLLKHAITNILSNAFKYSHNKRNPILKVFIDDGNLKISVKDFGIGIPENELKNIFKSFFRGSNVGTIQGTGIGLMIVDYAMKKHNGRVEIKRERDDGTVFTLIIPRNNA